MNDRVMERYIDESLATQPGPEATIAWQGGEPTLMGLDFFRRSVAYAEKHSRPGQRVRHVIQTNGTRMDDRWAAFFKENRFLVGLSVDGPRAVHDLYRVNEAGAGTFDQVMRAWDALSTREVDCNILCVLHAGNENSPLEVYRFFRDALGASFIQFIPVVERATGGQASAVTERSIRPERYGDFLISVFDEWAHRDVGNVFVQTFDAMLGAYLGQYLLCVHAPACGCTPALEHNGDLYACDHYVEPAWLLGNIMDSSMAAMVALPKQRGFGRAKTETLPGCCRTCDVRFACHGGCPKDRFMAATGGEMGLKYLCEGYRRFFRHAGSAMEIMARMVRQ